MSKTTYPGHVLHRGGPGPGIRKLQRGLKKLHEHYAGIEVDGDFGKETERYVRQFQARHGEQVDGEVGRVTWARIFNEPVAPRPKKTMQEKAYGNACDLIGVMEIGGNNIGPMVERIIRENNGARGEPWCGDFMAYVYRKAGSKSVTRSWAAVRLMLTAGVTRTSKPIRGDIVRFNFSHTGMFVRDLGNGTIETIEGNTGASGAVSDSATGGDGVYRKVRSKALVTDYLHVHR